MSSEITETHVVRAIEQARQAVGYAQERLATLRAAIEAGEGLEPDEIDGRLDSLDEAADDLETADRHLESAATIVED